MIFLKILKQGKAAAICGDYQDLHELYGALGRVSEVYFTNENLTLKGNLSGRDLALSLCYDIRKAYSGVRGFLFTSNNSSGLYDRLIDEQLEADRDADTFDEQHEKTAAKIQKAAEDMVKLFARKELYRRHSDAEFDFVDENNTVNMIYAEEPVIEITTVMK